jgi:hypothetical protein
MAISLLTASIAMLAMANIVRSIPEDICQPRGCPDPNGPALFGDAILHAANCGPNGLIECGVTQYPSMKRCVCPNDLVCVEQVSQELWTEESKYIGTCVGRVCNDNPDTPKSQRQCHSPQTCVHKILGLESAADGTPRASVKGRCLSRTCSEDMLPGPCPSGWTCVRDSNEPNGRGLCAFNSFKW